MSATSDEVFDLIDNQLSSDIARGISREVVSDGE
jgi:hypothetical protein